MAFRNIASVDVEDYYQVEAFSDIVDRTRWDSYPSRVENNTRQVLDLLDVCGVKATFFIVGWVAERYGALVREIVARGHEPACHSYWHRVVYRLDPKEFRQDTERAKAAIEHAAGEQVRGYRAPNFSITAKSAWAPAILAELGFTYDSSVFPVRHDIYGSPDAPRTPFFFDTPSGRILEYPMTTFRVGSTMNFPVAGGGYLRMLPEWYTRSGVRRAWDQGIPVITYVHPWEFDPEQPRLGGRLKSRIRHYTNLSKMAERWKNLLRMGSFGPFRDSGLEPDSQALYEFQSERN